MGQIVKKTSGDLVKPARQFLMTDSEDPVDQLEAFFLNHFEMYTEERTFHHLENGVYLREMHIKAGEVAIGHRHKHEHIFRLCKGKLLVIDLANDTSYEIEAPFQTKAKPGRKLVYAITDVVVQNVYLTDKTTIEEIENEMVVKSDIYKERLLCQ